MGARNCYRVFYLGVAVVMGFLSWLLPFLLEMVENDERSSSTKFLYAAAVLNILRCFCLFQFSYAIERVFKSIVKPEQMEIPAPELRLLLGNFKNALFSKRSVRVLITCCWVLSIASYLNEDEDGFKRVSRPIFALHNGLLTFYLFNCL